MTGERNVSMMPEPKPTSAQDDKYFTASQWQLVWWRFRVTVLRCSVDGCS